jgi:signal transduction histidine kinase/CheY-like chemotaxis protein
MEYLLEHRYHFQGGDSQLAADILTRLHDFKAVPSDLYLGATEVPLLLTFEVESRSPETQEVFIVMPRQYFWRADLFVIRDGKVTEHSAQGVQVPSNALKFPNTKSAFSVNLKAGERVRLLFYSELAGPVDVTTQLYTLMPFVSHEFLDLLINGTFYGIMLGLILYNLVIFIALKDVAYLYYVLLASGLVGLFSTLNGVGRTYLWPQTGSLNAMLIFVFACSYIFLVIKYLQAFLPSANTRFNRVTRALSLALTVVAIAYSVMAIGLGWFSKLSAANLMAWIAVLCMTMQLFLAFRAARAGFRPAKLLLFSYLPLGVATILRALAQNSVVDQFFLTNLPHQFAAACEMILMSVAMADRINYITKLHQKVEIENQGIRLTNLRLLEHEKMLERENDAVLRTTQMLAHDVRKPFSILRMGLSVLGHAKDPDSMKGVIDNLVPEVDAAIKSVDGLVTDIMEIGSSSSEVAVETVDPQQLIAEALGQIFSLYPKANVDIKYNLAHRKTVSVQLVKVGRVFSNIYVNAIQAIGGTGVTWFETRDVVVSGKPFVEFCIGNSGSEIPEENIAKIFDAFFTSGKKNGIGLGLAIAQKVILSHGGRIWCRSDRRSGYSKGRVEFYFTLPASREGLVTVSKQLPAHSSEFVRSSSCLSFDRLAREEVDADEKWLEGQILNLTGRLGRSLSMLIVDDEAAYLTAMASYIERNENFASAVSLVLVKSSNEALASIDKQKFDLIITDIDMGSDSQSGFDLVRVLRNRGVSARICVHSNRIIPSDQKTALLVGADVFLPKPMPRAQCLRLLLQAGQALIENERLNALGLATESSSITFEGHRPEVLLIEDNPFIRFAWEEVLKVDAQVHLMSSLDDLNRRISEDPGFLNRLSCIITDLYLDGSSGDGLEIGRVVKAKRPGLPIYLSSDAVVTEAECAGAVDRVIGKLPLDLRNLIAA